MPSPTELPQAVREATERIVGSPVTGFRYLSGGQVDSAACIETSAQRLFAKWTVEPGEDSRFVCEADGLNRLRAANTLRIPRVIVTLYPETKRTNDVFDYLALEWIEPVSIRDVRAFSRRFAEGLAALHRNLSPDGTFGLEADNYLGKQPQPNQNRTTDWAAFYRDNRLLPQIERAKNLGLVSPAREARLNRVIERLPELLAGMPSEASLIHGDLWSGNFLCTTDDEPALIDPAVYYAPREMEMAYVQLFGGFPPGFVDDYHAVWPLDDGYDRRRPLHQLYPLLIHLNHFGEKYGPAVDGVCRLYLDTG